MQEKRPEFGSRIQKNVGLSSIDAQLAYRPYVPIDSLMKTATPPLACGLRD